MSWIFAVLFLSQTSVAEQPVPSPETTAEPAPSAEGALATPTEAASPPDTAKKNPVWVAIPNIGFDTDDGLGFGARAEFDWYKPGYDPYQLALVFQGYTTTSGYHHHRVRFDAPGLGSRHNLRLSGHFAYRQWLNDGWWGIGNGTAIARKYADDSDGEQDKRYRYTLIQPFGRLTLRADIVGPWAVFGFLGGRWSKIETYPDSLLAEEQPVGMEGGWAAQVGAGGLYDTREPEMTPEKGHLIELAARVSPKLPGVEGEWWAPYASWRGFLALGPGVVIGSRVCAEYQFGVVPFYDYITWGGLVPMLGVGGGDTLRGTSFGRWRAPGKALWNTELRIDVFKQEVLHREIRWQLVPFFDAATVWGAGETAASPIHPALGLGIHPIVAETFVGRLDVAMGLENIRETTGEITWEPSLGVYLLFEHVF